MKKQYRKAIQGVYKGYWCDSSWELAYVIYNLENGIKFQRCTQAFPYKWYRKMRYYYPDFIENNIYIEIKGIMSNKDKRKLNWFKYPIRILGPKEMKPYLDYVQCHYGNDFVKLYEKKQIVGYKK